MTTRTESPFPIVGVGASSGGLEALQALLQKLPTNSGMAFVLIQHLDPAHASQLQEILTQSTSLPVTTITSNVKVEPDHIYVLPPNSSLTMENGNLKLHPALERGGARLAIDYFLQSLAKDRQNQGIGVILSGTGTDGTIGLEAIKTHGGITFAQDEASAKYPAMPRYAAMMGCVDFVLSPEKIAEELLRISQSSYLREGLDGERLDSDDMSKILRLLQKATQIDFSNYKATTIQRRIRRRMALHKIPDLASYIRFLEDNTAELQAVSQDVLIKVTSFFRDPDAFQVLAEKVFPHIVQATSRTLPIRLWVTACSTGEEAYSLAIALQEYLDHAHATRRFQVFATDVSDSVITRARTGLYPENIALDVTPDRLRRFFVDTGNGYQISKTIRDACVFARQDITRDPPFSKIDLISCRNMLIYLEPAMQRKIMPIFRYALNPTGFLMLGTSETVGNFQALFNVVDKTFKIYGPREGSSRAAAPAAPSPAKSPRARFREKPRPGPAAPVIWSEMDLHRDVDRLLLQKYAPSAVVVNEALEIVHFRGHTSPYIEPASGKASLHILKMVREPLVLELRAALHKALANDTRIRKEGITFRTQGRTTILNLDVQPVRFAASAARYFVVIFEQGKEDPEKQRPNLKKAGRRKTSDAKETDRVARELFETRDQLQAMIEEQEASNEELQSANEEIMSANEELQSTNEELETAKEELQSTNEELTTVNEELQNRNQELTVVNNDLGNLLSGVNIPIVMLGTDLRIRRFTPTAEKLLNIIPTDIGRRISDLKPNIDLPELDALLNEVIDTMSPKELAARSADGRLYNVRIRPYKTRDNKIDGAVLTLLDVDAMSQARSEIHRLQGENKSLRGEGKVDA
jgi:two-component system CheB/CheR fusion protein